MYKRADLQCNWKLKITGEVSEKNLYVALFFTFSVYVNDEGKYMYKKTSYLLMTLVSKPKTRLNIRNDIICFIINLRKKWYAQIFNVVHKRKEVIARRIFLGIFRVTFVHKKTGVCIDFVLYITFIVKTLR